MFVDCSYIAHLYVVFCFGLFTQTQSKRLVINIMIKDQFNNSEILIMFTWVPIVACLFDIKTFYFFLWNLNDHRVL